MFGIHWDICTNYTKIGSSKKVLALNHNDAEGPGKFGMLAYLVA